MTRGRFIVLEGGEGAGKSTQCRRLVDHLERIGARAVVTREPGGSPLAEAIRDIVLDDWPESVDATTELLLIFAARAAHLHATIRPALEDGKIVLCDRFVDATWAYQGAGRGVDPGLIATLESAVLGDLRPDLTLVLDVPADVGLARAHARGETNRFEAETLAFIERVRNAYLDRAALAPHRYAVIDARLPENEVTRQLIDAVQRVI